MAGRQDILSRWRCRRLHAWLVDYADGALAARERERVERHLTTCAECAVALAALRELPAVLRAAPVAPGEEFWRRQRQDIMRAVRQPQPLRHRPPLPAFAWRTATVAVTAGLIAVVGYRLLPHPMEMIEVARDIDALDAETVIAVSDIAEVLAPRAELMAAGRGLDDEMLASVALHWAPPEIGGAPDVPDLSDEELDRLGELIGITSS